MKVRVKVAQTGLYNGAPWPAVGEEVDLPDHVAEGMLKADQVEKASAKKPPTKAADPEKKVETRPAPAKDVETRAPKKG